MSDNPPSSDTQRSKPAGIDWLATTAGALAAVTSALLLSTLGAVGTLVGAAIGSVAATVGTNLYSQWLAKSREKVARAQALARWRSAGLAGVRNGSEAVVESAAEADAGSEETGGTEQAPPWRERLSALPWKRIGLASLAMFAVVVATITVFELLAGRSVSSIVGDGDGGTTISGVTGGSGRSEKEPRKDPSSGATATPEESSSATADPSEDAQESESAAPSERPSPEASGSAGSSAEPSAQPSDGVSGGPSAPGEASPSAPASSEAADPASP